MTQHKPTSTRLRLREVHGHIAVTPDKMTAWYILTPQRWSFTTEGQRKALIYALSQRLADLAPCTGHIRITSRPYPFRDWAERLHENTYDPLPSWPEYLAQAQKSLRNSTIADDVVFLGIDLPDDRTMYERFAAKAAGRTGARTVIESRHHDTITRIDEIVAGSGMRATRVTTTDFEWLMHRSVRLMLPVNPDQGITDDDHWDTDDVHAFTEGVDYEYDKFGATVQVNADHNGTVKSHHVAVMSMGRMGKVNIPETSRNPWIKHTASLPFPVEWSIRFELKPGAAVIKETSQKWKAIRDMRRQYAAHDMAEPPDLARKADLATKVQDEATESAPAKATRMYAWFRLAVSGATEEEAVRRVRAVQSAYTGYQMSVMHPRSLGDAAGQRLLLDEFIPGQPLGSTAYLRRMPVRYFAAGMPNMSSTIGDNRGPRMGSTTGATRRAFMHDPHYSMEVLDSAGFVPVVSGLGGGKSAVLASGVYASTMRGVLTTALDPSGPFANLVHLPKVKDHARHLDLMAGGSDGIVNPYAVIADPLPQNYDTPTEYADAVKVAGQNRKVLATDIVRMLLPPQVDALPATSLVLSDAIRAVGTSPDTSMWDVVKALESHDNTEAARPIANHLRDMADMPMARLFFDNNRRDLTQYTDTLLVITMNGLQLPSPDAERVEWSTLERLGVPLLHLASHYTASRAYGVERDIRKMVALDEVGLMARWGSGKHLFGRLGADGRKFNIATWAASQKPSDILGLDVAAWISAAYIGRIEDHDTAAEALRFLRIQTGVGYEDVIGNLSPHIAGVDGTRTRGAREFIVRYDGNVEKVRIEITDEDLLKAIETRPTGRKRNGARPIPEWVTAKDLVGAP